MGERQLVLQKWLTESCQLSTYQIESMPGDASFRRYFRVQLLHGSYIAMDAYEEREKCLPFMAIADALRAEGLITPHIIAHDLNQGFLLLSDFGNQVLLHELNHNNAELLYTRALSELAKIQKCVNIPGVSLPPFTFQFMREELNGFKEWFLQKHLEQVLSPATEKDLAICFDFLADQVANQPTVFMHRDYHSANLMILPQNKIGILDFQDAFCGPVTYDAVSLLRDCYIAWPDTLITKLVLYYYELLELPVSQAEFLYWFDITGLQRHLKALLTFSRKYHRDGNANYLKHIPRTVNYITTIAERYSECRILNTLMNDVIVSLQT